ncbi:PREDICTED: putative F-box protein At1g47300 [Corvus brachyrhynchos]|uniref:putative F-box protein At1g47300 n=1 Tax=Corvus brachyrhynchos TaxID=85066 RepID=UPI0008164D86|nr:PREDICTED: putative F-box protein At1g47300 [Corvus brachyrhynchos]
MDHYCPPPFVGLGVALGIKDYPLHTSIPARERRREQEEEEEDEQEEEKEEDEKEEDEEEAEAAPEGGESPLTGEKVAGGSAEALLSDLHAFSGTAAWGDVRPHVTAL